MLLLFYMPIAIAVVFFVILPLVVFIVIAWTRNSPIQRGSALAFVPLAVVVGIGFNAASGSLYGRQASGDMRPEYLKRTIDKPVGKVDYLVLAGRGGNCREECIDVLVNGIANSFSYGTVGWETKDILTVGQVNRLAKLSECSEETAKYTLGYLQSEGIFDACIVEAPAGILDAALLIGGDDQDRMRVVRKYGPQMVAVAQPVINGEIGPEMVRWEYGELPYSGTRVGAAFRPRDFIRALTGINTDRLGELKDLTIAQRIDRIYAETGKSPLMLYPVFNFLGKTPGTGYLPARIEALDTVSSRKLQEIGKAICQRSPKVRNFAGGPPEIDCVVAYNRSVKIMFPKISEKLNLPVDQSAL